MHPYIYLSPTPGGGQRGLDDLRQGIRDSLAGEAWYRLYAQAEADLDAEPLAAGQLQPASPEDLMPHLPPAGSAIGGRILRGALAWQITGTEAFATCAAEQIDALWADPHGPAWRGEQVGSLPAACALADGVFASAVGLDWLWESLNPAGRQRWMAELGARVLEPFVAAGPGALDELGLFGRAAVSAAVGVAAEVIGEGHPASAPAGLAAGAGLDACLDGIGPDGRAGPSPAAAGWLNWAARLLSARSAGALGDERLIRALHWALQMTLPPGWLTPMAGCPPLARPPVEAFAAVARATGDGPLWRYCSELGSDWADRADPLELVFLPAGEAPSAETTALPLGWTGAGPGAWVVSRSDASATSAASVVYGLGGMPDRAGEAGGVFLDAFAQPLLVNRLADAPAPGSDQRQAANGPRAGLGSELPDPAGEGRLVSSEFDPARGGCWRWDLSPLLPGGCRAFRTVVHLLPDVLVVVDDLQAIAKDELVVRWHTAEGCFEGGEGRFFTQGDDVCLTGRLARLDGPAVFLSGTDEADGRRGPFVELRTVDAACRMLSLFAVFAPHGAPEPWRHPPEDYWTVDAAGGLVEVRTAAGVLSVQNVVERRGWKVPLEPEVS
mgnify:FL=1